MQAMKYALNNLPIKDKLLKKASFVEFSSRGNIIFS